METKTCRRCHAPKPVSEFAKCKPSKDGLYSYCKACVRAAYLKRREDPAYVAKCRANSKKWDAENPEKRRELTRRHEARHPELRAEQKKAARLRYPGRAAIACRKWREKNPEKVVSSQAAWYRANRDKKLAADKARREQHLEVFLERERLSYEKHAEARSDRARRWREKNPHKVARAASMRRAALINRTPGWLTDADFAAMDEVYRIAQCFKGPDGRTFHVDHIYPLRGRLVSGLHVPSNLQILPPEENLRKSNKWEV